MTPTRIRLALALAIASGLAAIGVGCRSGQNAQVTARNGANDAAVDAEPPEISLATLEAKLTRGEDPALPARPAAAAKTCGALKLPAPAERSSLHGDRLTAVVPKGATSTYAEASAGVGPSGSSIMLTKPNKDPLEAPLVLFTTTVTEMLATDPGNTPVKIRAGGKEVTIGPLRDRLPGLLAGPLMATPDTLKLERVKAADDSLRLYVARPPTVHVEHDRAPLAAGVVVLPDHTLLLLSVAVGGAVVQGHDADCMDFAEAVLASVAKGPRDLLLAAGPVQFARVEVEKTEGAALTHMRGPDWDEYSLHPVVPLGLPSSGVHFTFDWARAASPPQPTSVERAGTMFGSPMKWRVDADGTRMMARVPLPKEAVSRIHMELLVQAWGPDRATADSQRAIAETLKVP